jgi:Predicted integral membrane protein (DUF2269)
MTPLLATLLFLHVISAIVAFGPVFAFPVVASMGQRNPQHGLFAVELSERLETRMVIPVALTMPITGVAMILVAGISPFTNFWLATAIVLYTIAILYALFVQVPAVRQLAGLLRQMPSPPPPSPEGAPAGSSAPGVPSGPPPRVAQVSTKVARGGQFLSVLVVLIVLLMVTKITF